MFSEQDLTPELKEELRRQQVVVAHSRREARDVGLMMRTGFGVPAYNAAMVLDAMLQRWKGFDTAWSVLQGIRVLDLASGSAASQEVFGPIRYPHFSRLCAINGADVLAIDIRPQQGLDERMFKWAQVNLVEVVYNEGLSALPSLQGSSFGMIHSSDFVGANLSPELLDQLALKGVGVSDFEKRLFQQAGTLLKEEGVMYLGGRSEQGTLDLYTRRGENIVKIAG